MSSGSKEDGEYAGEDIVKDGDPVKLGSWDLGNSRDTAGQRLGSSKNASRWMLTSRKNFCRSWCQVHEEEAWGCAL
jgi:hypothetical protein